MQRKPTKAYWSSYGALYGNEKISEVKPAKKRQQKERQAQFQFNVWWDKEMLPLGRRWYHVPNGGSRNPIEAVNLKRSGVKAGIPDIVIPMARKSYHGLVIELKMDDKKKAKITESQEDWHIWFRNEQWCVEVAYGFEQAKFIVLDYFS